jgi:hypothetical protein
MYYITKECLSKSTQIGRNEDKSYTLWGTHTRSKIEYQPQKLKGEIITPQQPHSISKSP